MQLTDTIIARKQAVEQLVSGIDEAEEMVKLSISRFASRQLSYAAQESVSPDDHDCTCNLRYSKTPCLGYFCCQEWEALQVTVSKSAQ